MIHITDTTPRRTLIRVEAWIEPDHEHVIVTDRGPVLVRRPLSPEIRFRGGLLTVGGSTCAPILPCSGTLPRGGILGRTMDSHAITGTVTWHPDGSAEVLADCVHEVHAIDYDSDLAPMPFGRYDPDRDIAPSWRPAREQGRRH